MIAIKKDASKVKLSVNTGILSSEGSIDFTFDCEKEMYAELLRSHIDKKLDERIKGIRKEEYEKGWKDAKSHKTKETWFSPLLKLIR